jgi:hypothetical protein
MSKRSGLWLFALAVASINLASGCGGEGMGGANAETTVKIRPTDSASDPNGGPADGQSKKGETAAAEGFGTLHARVVFEGTAPTLSPLIAKGAQIKDAICSAQAVPNESLVVGDGNGVENVFVWLQKIPKGAPASKPSEDPVIFDQVGCRFTPHAMVVRVGRPVNIVSGDNLAHNTHTFPVRNPTGFNQVIKALSRVGEIMTYEKSENQPIQVKCDFHAWMIAYQLPLDHPFGAVTDKNGELTIEGLPAGEHKFKVWHEAAGFLSRNLKVTIKPDETTEQTIPYPASKYSP